MLSEELKAAIRMAIGIEEFAIGSNYKISQDGKRESSIWITSIWVVEFWMRYSGLAILAGVHNVSSDRSNKYKCTLLISSKRNYTATNFVGKTPFRSIDLEFPDPVFKSLRNMNMLPVNYSLIESPYPYFNIYTYSLNGESYQKHRGELESDNMVNLWSAITDTLERMVRLYDDPEISHLFNTKQIP